MSFHNMRGYGEARDAALDGWANAPSARLCHPRAEHLLPLMVAAGASDAPGTHDYGEPVMHTAIPGYRFA
jgi:aromatic ring-opening dioxygenase catalytic subunit (LigB family)